MPAALSQTGLYSDIANGVFAADVQYYEPKYALWSDGADKRRWVKLPKGAQIDTSDMDNWRYPIGTKIWKEFAKGGQQLETRYMAKYGPDSRDWVLMAYQWNAGDAFAVPDGVPNTAGTSHDIPSEATCRVCHQEVRESALGLSAIQLSHERQGLTLNTLVADGSLSQPPLAPLTLPGDAVAQNALGYLHANCGGCHNRTSDSNNRVVFWQSADQLASVEQTTTYVSLVTNTNGDLSVLRRGVERMRSRSELQMPPIGTEVVDDQGVAIVDAWLQRLAVMFPQTLIGDPAAP